MSERHGRKGIMTRDTFKKRHNLLIAVALILFLGVVYRYFPLASGMIVSSGDISTAQKKLEKLQGLVQKKEALQKTVLAANTQLAKAENGLLRGKTAALAAVDLQNRLAAITSAIDVSISSQRVLKPVKQRGAAKQPYIGIPVQVTMTVTIRQLEQVLHGIANSDSFLKVTDATVKRSAKEKHSLQAVLTVSGLMPATGTV